MTRASSTHRHRVIIMGAAGRDFHNFAMVYRDDPTVQVMAFTAAQIPAIADRRYPASLAGPLYPDGIAIVPEESLVPLIREQHVDEVTLAYSDLAHLDVMHMASRVLAAGATFSLLGPNATMLNARVPVISVGAVRTGAGKSPLARYLVCTLRDAGLRVVALRHPMPYGDLARQAVQRFASSADLDRAEATIEEREEYEPYLAIGAVVYAGVDYRQILDAAQFEADVIVWDGGNNDMPFIRPDLHLVVLDAHRPGHELAYHPGEANVRMADALIISKVDSAPPTNVDQIIANAHTLRPQAPVIRSRLEVTVDHPEAVHDRRVVIVEDGPTLTHGGLALGAGTIAGYRYGVSAFVDARPYAVGSIAAAYTTYPHLRGEVPALGYHAQQIADLEATLRSVPADVILAATPIDLGQLIRPGKPIVRVRYEFQEEGDQLRRLLERFMVHHALGTTLSTARD